MTGGTAATTGGRRTGSVTGDFRREGTAGLVFLTVVVCCRGTASFVAVTTEGRCSTETGGVFTGATTGAAGRGPNESGRSPVAAAGLGSADTGLGSGASFDAPAAVGAATPNANRASAHAGAGQAPNPLALPRRSHER